MVYNSGSVESDMMPQMVPSAGFTPPCDYSVFAADSFDLSLLPGGETDLPLSPSTLFYTQSPPPTAEKPKIYTTYFPNSPEEGLQVSHDIELGPDFQKLLIPSERERSARSPIHLEVPANNYYPSSPSSYCSSTDLYQKSLISPQYPSSPCESFTLYPSSPSDQSVYSLNKADDSISYFSGDTKVSFYSDSDVYLSSEFPSFNQLIKKEDQTSTFSTTSEDNFPIYSPFQIKEENFLSPYSQVNSPNSCTNYSNHSSPVDPNYSSPIDTKIYLTKENIIPILEETFLESNFLNKPIKQESTVDFGELLQNLSTLKEILEDDFKKPEEPAKEDSTKKSKSQDHQLLRQVLKDTSFQKKFNLKPIDFELATGFVGSVIKMEEPDLQEVEDMTTEELTREKIEPVLSLAIEQMRKDVDNTCKVLGISQDPSQWSSDNVKAWIQWTVQQFNLPSVQAERFEMPGSELTTLSEEEFARRTPQSGSILHAQLEIWKAACMDEDINMQWTASCNSNQSSNASSGDISEDDDEEAPSTQTVGNKPSGSRTTGGSHIHLWQFLKELLASPQVHGSCIRWLDRGKGVFKIEDSVRVAKLWGKRKNRPAMNYDKLSRSIRQYYKKGIMKKTERSQRLVYQFCHPYSM